jgi:5-methylcytosine-specific restriction endonuclease McrBC GTP-binding regulatory subunit McrB
VANDDMGWNRKITFKNDLDENDKQLINDLLHYVGTFDMGDSPMNDNPKKPRTNKVHPLNFIVYGAPGTGKTYSMVEYALAIVDNISIEDFQKDNQDRKTNITRYKELVNDGQIVFTTFHQNYGYEDFIQGLRPDTSSGTLSFKIVDGVFKKIADRALDDEDNNYVIIIDEINRANISKVFGELITLIEEDKRWGELNEMSVTLQSGDDFVVPNNLYIIGTMNSADKSISLIDAALRRRFEFIEKKPDASLIQDNILRKTFEKINENLVKELDSTDLLVGHSYFMNKTEKDLCKILNNNIIPLLYEYFYDNRKKVANLLKEVIDKSDANVEIVDDKMGRLSVKDKVE